MTKTGKWKYIKVKVEDHPHSDNRGFVLCHRLVVEKSIGRFKQLLIKLKELNKTYLTRRQ